MATIKQIEANGRNAQKSTGPRTEAGRTASSQNSRKHGCYAGQVLLEGQDQEMYDQLLQEFMDELQPQTLRERNLVEMMAVEWWHLGQCEFMRRSFFSRQRQMIAKSERSWDRISDAERTGLVGENIAFYHLKDMVRISDLKSRVTRSYHRASREFDRLREERLRRQAEPEPEAQPEPESQPQPQAAENPAAPQPEPESASPVHQDTPPDVPVEPPTPIRSHAPEGAATIRTDALDHTAARPGKCDF
jgi:hypothetical protein